MKNNLAHITIAATLAIGAAANSHQHLHRHAKKDAIKARDAAPDAVTNWVAGPTETVYVMGDDEIDAKSAKECINEGKCVIVGETDPTPPPPPPPPPSSSSPPATSSSAPNLGAQFFEKSSSSPPPAYSTSQPPPPPQSSSTSQPSSPSQGTGLNAKFPSGQIKCSEFPSAYGAIALSWLDLGGWSGLQQVNGYTAAANAISNIVTGTPGQNCADGTMCSYACPPGYQKTQWPAAQGSTGQSVGGLWCNGGLLELTRPSSQTLCEKGAGGVVIQNDLSQNVATCRTDYPGTESMVIPIDSAPGSTMDVTNPVQNQYYQWQGKATSAQYYVNQPGVSVEDACVWNSPTNPKDGGNWAPMILGVGVGADGATYISLFPNAPTSSASLSFNVEIKGGNSECSYTNGQFSSGNGCTTTVQSGGKATIRFYSS